MKFLNNAKRLCTRNLTLKLLCLAVAFSIWCLNSVSRKTEAELILPVKLHNIPSGYIPSAKPPAVIEFTISGPSVLVAGARRFNTVLNLSLDRAVRPGKTIFAHLDTKLRLPDDIKVVRISPASLEVTLIPDHLAQGERQ